MRAQKEQLICLTPIREQIVGLSELGGCLFVYHQLLSHLYKLHSSAFAIKSAEH